MGLPTLGCLGVGEDGRPTVGAGDVRDGVCVGVDLSAVKLARRTLGTGDFPADEDDPAPNGVVEGNAWT